MYLPRRLSSVSSSWCWLSRVVSMRCILLFFWTLWVVFWVQTLCEDASTSRHNSHPVVMVIPISDTLQTSTVYWGGDAKNAGIENEAPDDTGRILAIVKRGTGKWGNKKYGHLEERTRKAAQPSLLCRSIRDSTGWMTASSHPFESISQ